LENSRDLLKRVSQVLRRWQVVHAVTGRAAVQAWRDLIAPDAIPADGAAVIDAAGLHVVSDVPEVPEIPATILIAARDLEAARRALTASTEWQIKFGRTVIDTDAKVVEADATVTDGGVAVSHDPMAVADGAEESVDEWAALRDARVDGRFSVESPSGVELVIRPWTEPTDRHADARAVIVLTDTVILDDVPVLSVQNLVRDILINAPGDRESLGALIELGLVDSAAYDWIPTAYVPTLTRIFEEVDA
jgi:hypothetical protein